MIFGISDYHLGTGKQYTLGNGEETQHISYCWFSLLNNVYIIRFLAQHSTVGVVQVWSTNPSTLYRTSLKLYENHLRRNILGV